MPTKIQKWGNSLGLRLPKNMADKFKLRAGSHVSLFSDEKGIFIKPLKRKATMESFLAEIKPENLHGEFNLGAPTGKEIW